MRVLHMLNQWELAKAAMYGTSVIVVSNLAENDSMRCPGFERVQGNFWLFYDAAHSRARELHQHGATFTAAIQHR